MFVVVTQPPEFGVHVTVLGSRVLATRVFN